MQKIILNITTLCLLIFLSTACSKKTTAASNNQASSSKQEARKQKGERPQFSELLSKMDTNKDGKLSQAEAKGPLKNGFSDIDKDKDGFISETEFKNAPRPTRRGRS